MKKTIHIAASTPYDVLIGHGLLSEAGRTIRAVCPRAEKAFVLTEDHVAPLYLKEVLASLRGAGMKVESMIFPHGEAHKTVETWQAALESMCEKRFTRSDVLIALGGGVTGDLGGFAAATYQRGIDYVQVPTTLLAMVDSSVGGKTAIDLAGEKNQVGAFYQPRCVICDPDTLFTLPEEEYQCGCAEIIKYGMIGSADFFRSLQETPVRAQVNQVIATCVEMKRDYVLQDEFDRGLRMMLNFGHTFGHACEACSHFSILHGQGVAIGMAIMARAAAAQGIFPAEDLEALIHLLQTYELPTEPSWEEEVLFQACLNDKKAAGSSISIVVPEKIGACGIRKIPVAELRRWLRLGII